MRKSPVAVFTPRFLAGAFFACMMPLTVPSPAEAEYNLVSVGPSFGTVAARDAGDTLMAYSLDVTLAEGNILHNLASTWCSAGIRIAGGEYVFPYAEAGLSVFVNIGAGYGGAYHEDGGYRQCVHLFAGVPIPLVPLGDIPGNRDLMYVPYIQPFYRPVFSIGRTLLFHEFGCLVKMALWF